MSNEQTNVAESANATEKEVVKKSRRGLGSVRGTSRLKFTHELAKQNGLFVGHLDSIEIKNILIGEDKTGLPSFNGLEIPRLTLTFASNEEDVNKRHYVTQQFTAVESNANTIPGGKEEWKVTSVFNWLKHVLNVYVLKGREMTDEEDAALSLSYEDFDEQGEYVPVEPEVVINAWKVLFENFENILSRGNNGEPYYKTKAGKNITIWLKLIRYVKNAKKSWQPVNNGDLAFPTFVGEGCIEMFSNTTLPSIRVDLTRESIIPMNIEKPKAPNMPIANMGMSAPSGSVMPAMGSIPVVDNIAAAAMEEDLPF